MAFSKIAGLEVCPRSDSSRTSRSSSPPCVIERRIWSSHTLVPAAVIAASRSFTVASVAMSAPFQICVESIALDRVHLAEPPHVAFLAGERRIGERLDELGGDRRPDDAGADAEHVAVVVA